VDQPIVEREAARMTLDRADEIIDVLGSILEELRVRPVDRSRLFQLSDELTAIETELAIEPETRDLVRA
jgi:hypothetical protein